MSKKQTHRQKQIDRVLIICEGYEEEDYLKRLKSLGVWKAGITVDVENAKSRDRIEGALDDTDGIISIYRDRFGNENYKAVVILYDTEGAPYEDFKRIRKNISDTYGKRICDKILFFVNPFVMQVILSHGLDGVKLNVNDGHSTLAKIEEFCGVRNYCKDEHDRNALVSKVTRENYPKMKERVRKLSTNYERVPSTNIMTLFDALDGTDSKWLSSVMEEIKRR